MNHNPTDRSGGDLDRRTFLQAGALATGTFAGTLGLGGRLPAARPQRGGGGGGALANKVTIVLFQRGGADHLNLYAPVGDPAYAALRPTIGIQPPGSSTGVVGLPMDATFAMNPALTGLHAEFTAGSSRLAIVHAVGYAPYERSHFESQDRYETGLASGANADGWINRHLQVTATPNDPLVRALALRGSPPRALAGAYPTYSVGSTADLVFAGPADVEQTLTAIVQGTPTGAMTLPARRAYETGVDAFDLIQLFGGLDPANYVPANGAVYPAGGLGQALREVAEIIKADLGVEFFAVDQGGWDQHSDLQNRMAGTAGELDAAVTALLTDLGPLMADVVLLTMSEFGREAGENGSGGTDHGVGGAMAVLGAGVHGGQVRGAWPGLAPTALESGRFLAAQNDFRDVLREVLDVHMGGTDPNIVFPGHTHSPLGVL